MFHKINGLSVGILLLVNLFLWNSPTVSAQTDTCPNAPPPKLVVGQPALVTPGVPNNLRKSPARSADSVAAIPGDTAITVLAAPKCADGLRWWYVTDGKFTGWMADGSGKDYYVIPIATDPATVFTFDGVTPTPIAFRNIRLTYVSGFGKTIQMEVNPVTTPNNFTQTPLFGAAYTHFSFPDVPKRAGPGADIYVFASADITSATGESGEPDSEIIQLQGLLKKHPPTFDVEPALPLRTGGARLDFATLVRYLKFNGGTGIRYISHYEQADFPVLADSLLYEFQGLTDDGRYYIMANFPVSSSILSPTFEGAVGFPGAGDYGDTAVTKRMADYFRVVTAQLTAAPPSTFAPRLDQIDALMQSIIVHYINIRTDWF